MDGKIVLEGSVESVIFHNADNGFTVFTIEVLEKEAGEVVCVGNITSISVGENVKLTGTYITHPVYGEQLSVEVLEKVAPNSERNLERYLGSGIIKGVRERLARKIVKKFGKDTLDIIESSPERLTQVRGISLEKAMSIGAIFQEQAEMRGIMLYLQELSISPAYAMKIYKKYKQNTQDVIRQNPYILAEEILGIGFKTADAIAFRAGIEKEAPNRIRAGIKYSLRQASGNGHVYLPKRMLVGSTAELLDLDSQLVENEISELQINKVIWQEDIGEEKAVYLNYFYYAESFVAKRLVELSLNVGDKKGDISHKVSLFEQEAGVKLAENQKKAVEESARNGSLVITGGPGTGKTTTINAIINILESEGHKIELAAPTGRAAKRISEATGREAKTIHRLLETSFADDASFMQSFARDEDNPLEADVLIVDECSMIDIILMFNLLKAVAGGTRLILVGDADQLPSVGPGNVLKDIISSGVIKVSRLTEIFRQAQESAIVMNAHRINKGEYPVLNEKARDFFFIKRQEVDSAVNTILELITKRLPKFISSNNIQDIQVLTPMRKSPLGVANLNRILQRSLNPPGKHKNEKEFRDIIFREGDKVMQIKNNYGASWQITEKGQIIEEGQGIFNGDTGTIKKIDDFEETISVLYDGNRMVSYDYSQLEELELAFAMTIHKSQGSEYRAVIIPIHSGPPMLMSRNLLYTAVTRAKELVVIVGIPETLKKMVDNNREINRYSSLAQRLVRMRDVLGEGKL